MSFVIFIIIKPCKRHGIGVWSLKEKVIVQNLQISPSFFLSFSLFPVLFRFPLFSSLSSPFYSPHYLFTSFPLIFPLYFRSLFYYLCPLLSLSFLSSLPLPFLPSRFSLLLLLLLSISHLLFLQYKNSYTNKYVTGSGKRDNLNYWHCRVE